MAPSSVVESERHRWIARPLIGGGFCFGKGPRSPEDHQMNGDVGGLCYKDRGEGRLNKAFQITIVTPKCRENLGKPLVDGSRTC